MFPKQPPRRHEELVVALDNLLPQTQCTQCGYSGCKPYAQAIAAGETDINRCAPGGQHTIKRIADLLNRPVKQLDPLCGTPPHSRQLAWIDPEACIGCTRCIRACPTDAIIGVSLHLHAVCAQACTGCRLCVPACPVDCIVMTPVDPNVWSDEDANTARIRFNARQERLVRLGKNRKETRQVADAPAQTALPRPFASENTITCAKAELPFTAPPTPGSFLGQSLNLEIIRAATRRAKERLRFKQESVETVEPTNHPS